MAGVLSAMTCTTDGYVSGNGIQFMHDGRRVAVGSICETHKLDWERPINLNPEDPRWRDLYFAALLEQTSGTVSVVTGCPYSMLNSFRGKVPKGLFKFDTPTGKRDIEVLNASVMPECAGHALAFSEAFDMECIVISLGFGTVELGAANKDGVIENSLESITYGLHHCASPIRTVMEQKGIDCSRNRMDQYFYFDNILRKAYLKDDNLNFINRNGQTLDFSHLRPAAIEILKNYGKELVPRIRSYFTRFSEKMPVVITGGGVNYAPVREALEEMFKMMRYSVTIADKDTSVVSAAAGYRIAARRKYPNIGIGIDVGNHNVVVMGSGK